MRVELNLKLQVVLEMTCLECHHDQAIDAEYATDCFLAQKAPLCLRCLSAGKRRQLWVKTNQTKPEGT